MRIFLAIAYFFKILFVGEKALINYAQQRAVGQAKDEPSAAKPEPTVAPVFHVSTAPAIQLLGLLQKEGRLIDFLQEDISPYDDADIGAAMRDIHGSCRKVLDKHFALKRILTELEGENVTIAAGFDPSRIQIQGDISHQEALTGAVLHGGWIATKADLPTVAEGADENVVAAAQVEVKA